MVQLVQAYIASPSAVELQLAHRPDILIPELPSKKSETALSALKRILQ